MLMLMILVITGSHQVPHNPGICGASPQTCSLEANICYRLCIEGKLRLSISWLWFSRFSQGSLQLRLILRVHLSNRGAHFDWILQYHSPTISIPISPPSAPSRLKTPLYTPADKFPITVEHHFSPEETKTKDRKGKK